MISRLDQPCPTKLYEIIKKYIVASYNQTTQFIAYYKKLHYELQKKRDTTYHEVFKTSD